jgi:hypothetical protein
MPRRPRPLATACDRPATALRPPCDCPAMATHPCHPRAAHLCAHVYVRTCVRVWGCASQLVLLLWLGLSLNRKLALAAASHATLPELLTSLSHLVLTWAADLSCASAVHLAVLSMLLLSAEVQPYMNGGVTPHPGSLSGTLHPQPYPQRSSSPLPSRRPILPRWSTYRARARST